MSSVYSILRNHGVKLTMGDFLGGGETQRDSRRAPAK